MTSLSGILSSDWVHGLGWTLLHSLWEIALVAAVLALLLALLRGRSANLRYVISCLGLAAMFGLPMVTYCIMPDRPASEVSAAVVPSDNAPETSTTTPLPSTEVPGVDVPSTGVPGVEVPSTGLLRAEVPGVEQPNAEAPVIAPSIPVEEEVSVPTPPEQPQAHEVSTPLLRRVAQVLSPWMPWCVMAWLLGVLSLSVWNLGGWIAAQRLKHLGTTAVGEQPTARVADLVRRMKVSRPVRMLQSCLLDVPIVVGWLRPVILMPVGILTGFSPAQLDAILAHELAHIRRHDYLVNLFQTVAETLLFYHPGVWWISRWIRMEREHCCDDVAVAVCGSKVDHAAALTALEESRVAPRVAVATTGTEQGGAALGRVRRVLGLPGSDSYRWRSSLAGSLTVLVLVATLVGYMAMASGSDRNPGETAAPERTAQPATQAAARSPTRDAESKHGEDPEVLAVAARLRTMKPNMQVGHLAGMLARMAGVADAGTFIDLPADKGYTLLAYCLGDKDLSASALRLLQHGSPALARKVHARAVIRGHATELAHVYDIMANSLANVSYLKSQFGNDAGTVFAAAQADARKHLAHRDPRVRLWAGQFLLHLVPALPDENDRLGRHNVALAARIADKDLKSNPEAFLQPLEGIAVHMYGSYRGGYLYGRRLAFRDWLGGKTNTCKPSSDDWAKQPFIHGFRAGYAAATGALGRHAKAGAEQAGDSRELARSIAAIPAVKLPQDPQKYLAREDLGGKYDRFRASGAGGYLYGHRQALRGLTHLSGDWKWKSWPDRTKIYVPTAKAGDWPFMIGFLSGYRQTLLLGRPDPRQAGPASQPTTRRATTRPSSPQTQPAARPAGGEAKPSADPAVRKALVEGWQAFHVFDDRKAAPPFDFAAVCEATAGPVLVKDLGHSLYWMQGRFKVIRVLHGRARAGQSLTIDYLTVSGAFMREASVSKGDRHLWVVRRGPGNRWVGVSRRQDTARARVILQKMMTNRAKPRSPMQRLIGAVDELRPGYWVLGDRRHGIVAPTQWKSGRGTQLTWRRSVYAPEDLRRGEGGEARLWIMDAGYLPKAHEHVDAKPSDAPKGPPAVEIATWRGRRVFLSGSAREWPNMKTDILAALEAITQPATRDAESKRGARPAAGGHAAAPEKQPARGVITPTPATAEMLCITDKWMLWRTHELIEATAGSRAQMFTIRAYLQRRRQKHVRLVTTLRDTRVRWKATVMDDGTVVLNYRGRLAWVPPEGKVSSTPGLYAKLDGLSAEPLGLYPDGVILRSIQRADEPIRAWFVPFKGPALATDKRIPLTGEKGFRFAKAPIHYKILRSGGEFAWSDDAGLHIVNIADGARRRFPFAGGPVQAFNGKTAVSGQMSLNLKSGKSRRLEGHFTFVAVRNGIAYGIGGVEQAISAYGHPKNLRLLVVDLDSGRQRTLVKWPNAGVYYIADSGPMGQSFISRVKWDYAPVLYAAEADGLMLWDGAAWRKFKWLTRIDPPATQPDRELQFELADGADQMTCRLPDDSGAHASRQRQRVRCTSCDSILPTLTPDSRRRASVGRGRGGRPSRAS